MLAHVVVQVEGETLHRPESQPDSRSESPAARDQVGAKLGLSEDQVGIMRITPDFVEVTFPDIANNSGQQRYRLLPEGKLLLEGEGQ